MSVFPTELAAPIAALDDYATVILRRGSYSDAIRIHKARYDVLKAVEKLTLKRIHKGSPLHMMGFCYSIVEPESALPYYASAHVEDVLSEGSVRAKFYSSYYTLSRAYLIPESFIDQFDNWIVQAQKQTSIPDPFDVLTQFESSVGKFTSQMKVARAPRLVFTKSKLVSISQTDESKRVFLGGAFNNILYLKQIENVINELGYYTIFADNFEKPTDMDDDEFTRTLLKYSRYALFEISVVEAAGHYVEIARAKDLKITSLGIYQSLTGSAHHFSGEISWLPKKPYSGFEQLKGILGEFLK